MRERERFDDGFKRRWPSRARRLLEGRFDASFAVLHFRDCVIRATARNPNLS